MNDNEELLNWKEELLKLKQLDEIDLIKKDCKYFIRKYCVSLDEHDPENPIKHFPDKQYIWEMIDLFLNERLLLIEKSRQMLITWTMVACHLWDVMFHEGRRIFFQSKKEQDANNLVERAKFIYNHLPDFIKLKYQVNIPMAYCKLEFGKWNSIIQGIPQGAEQLRQYTASRIFSDEMAFQEKAEEAYIAAQPTIVGGGSFIGVSSPNFKNFFFLLLRDKI